MLRHSYLTRILSLTIAAIFLLNNIAYAIDLPTRTHLRVGVNLPKTKTRIIETQRELFLKQFNLSRYLTKEDAIDYLKSVDEVSFAYPGQKFSKDEAIRLVIENRASIAENRDGSRKVIVRIPSPVSPNAPSLKESYDKRMSNLVRQDDKTPAISRQMEIARTLNPKGEDLVGGYSGSEGGVATYFLSTNAKGGILIDIQPFKGKNPELPPYWAEYYNEKNHNDDSIFGGVSMELGRFGYNREAFIRHELREMGAKEVRIQKIEDGIYRIDFKWAYKGGKPKDRFVIYIEEDIRNFIADKDNKYTELVKDAAGGKLDFLMVKQSNLEQFALGFKKFLKGDALAILPFEQSLIIPGVKEKVTSNWEKDMLRKAGIGGLKGRNYDKNIENLKKLGIERVRIIDNAGWGSANNAAVYRIFTANILPASAGKIDESAQEDGKVPPDDMPTEVLQIRREELVKGLKIYLKYESPPRPYFSYEGGLYDMYEIEYFIEERGATIKKEAGKKKISEVPEEVVLQYFNAYLSELKELKEIVESIPTKIEEVNFNDMDLATFAEKVSNNRLLLEERLRDFALAYHQDKLRTPYRGFMAHFKQGKIDSKKINEYLSKNEKTKGFKEIMKLSFANHYEDLVRLEEYLLKELSKISDDATFTYDFESTPEKPEPFDEKESVLIGEIINGMSINIITVIRGVFGQIGDYLTPDSKELKESCLKIIDILYEKEKDLRYAGNNIQDVNEYGEGLKDFIDRDVTFIESTIDSIRKDLERPVYGEEDRSQINYLLYHAELKLDELKEFSEFLIDINKDDLGTRKLSEVLEENKNLIKEHSESK
ncbi:MAG: hypothetical protein ABH848_04020 [Candidatus Omnitrophota bacterium]